MQARQIHALYVPMARRGDRGLAPLAHSTRRDVHSTLKMALKQAVRWGLIPQNPADLLNESAIAHFVAFSGKLSAVSKTNREDLRSAMGVKFVENGLTFDDVLIVPRRSSVYSRRDVSLRTRLVGDLTLELPIISANMDTVTELAMATAMAEAGGMGVIHRFVDDPETHADWVSSTPGHRFLAIGVKPADLEKIPMVEGLDGVVIDVAHGHSDRVTETIAAVREGYPEIWIVAGNVATAEGAWDLLEAGAHAVKVGVGPGAACTTRIVTGCGVPQLTAVLKVRAAIDRWWDAERRKARPRVEHPPALIADGGIRNSGDIAKALVAGADTVMIGSLFAGTDEAPGAVIRENGQAFKLYRGMASQGAMDRVGSDRTPEGVSTLIPHKGSVRALVAQLEGGIRSALSYCNSASIADLHEQTIEMVKVSPASVTENSPHALSLSPAQPQ